MLEVYFLGTSVPLQWLQCYNYQRSTAYVAQLLQHLVLCLVMLAVVCPPD